MDKKEKRSIRVEALQALYEMEFQNTKKDLNLLSPQAKSLIQGVYSKKNEIDQLLDEKSLNWKTNQMDLMDLNILRMAVYEILFLEPESSSKIFVNEAIELAKTYGRSDSSSFVNGILDAVLKDKERGA